MIDSRRTSAVASPIRRLATAPAGAPYHRLARTPQYRWWRPLAELLTAAALYVGMVGLVVVPLLVAGGTLTSQGLDLDRLGPQWRLAYATLSLALFIPASMAAAALTGRRRPGALSSVLGRLRWGWLGRCLTLGLVTTIAILSAGLVAGGLTDGWPALTETGWPGWAQFAPLALLVLVVVPLQAAGEEFAFRGALLQYVGAYARQPWVGIVVTAAPFVAAHGYGWHGSVVVAVSGLLAAWLTVRTGGLEAAIALHVANNTILFLLGAANGDSSSVLNSADSAVDWVGATVNILGQVGYAALVVRISTRHRVAQVVTPAATQPRGASVRVY